MSCTMPIICVRILKWNIKYQLQGTDKTIKVQIV